MDDHVPAARLRAELSVVVGGNPLGRWALPTKQNTVIGRSTGSAIRLRPGWCPRFLATLMPIEGGWLMLNGTRARVQVSSRWVSSAYWALPGAVIMLQPGRWLLRWELDDECRAEVLISHPRPGAVERLVFALSAVPGKAKLEQATLLAGTQLELEPATRHRLAVLFRYLIEDEPAPSNLCAAAAEQLGRTETQIRNSAYRVRDRLNTMRPAQIHTLEELGNYLVHTSLAIGPDDLDP